MNIKAEWKDGKLVVKSMDDAECCRDIFSDKNELSVDQYFERRLLSRVFGAGVSKDAVQRIVAEEWGDISTALLRLMLSPFTYLCDFDASEPEEEVLEPVEKSETLPLEFDVDGGHFSAVGISQCANCGAPLAYYYPDEKDVEYTPLYVPSSDICVNCAQARADEVLDAVHEEVPVDTCAENVDVAEIDTEPENAAEPSGELSEDELFEARCAMIKATNEYNAALRRLAENAKDDEK